MAEGYWNKTEAQKREGRSYGYEAGYSGKPLSANPGSGVWAKAWEEGWHAAQADLG